ncbi:1-deoxy-D-xylulose-5-phosphate synthase [Allorhizocola rhizosphaerae]|uniref:1-deoxy-D-xylulose-5-phosphate synthase n=1 Tax=Allorhizocola rhizosphaerae TaxID=1872709 RepID=UPI000E3C2F7D|nr:1-deoxy-D-xylulose-5-phosphate synthase [Allorhizocola rhizosphaerae]
MIDTLNVLSALDGPAELRELSHDALQELAADIRAELVEQVTRTGGHLGPNLGTVELCIALHRVFDSPDEPIIFDTGHQAYPHKMLTGRAGEFRRLRQAGGLSGYPSRAESIHDVVENSHASTALAYADGIARARSLRGDLRPVVAVIGDGAMTGGLAWEGLNNISDRVPRRLVVVLNDNGRSYAPTIGGFAAHLGDLAGRRRRLDAFARADGNIFTSLGLGYIGPVDGHDVGAVESALRRARACAIPTVVHCLTVKGKGYHPAERDTADCMHGVSSQGAPSAPAATSWTDVFSSALVGLGATNQQLVCLTAAMLRPVGLAAFADRFPDRVVDVGMAEQHAAACAAGFAYAGMHPVVAIYSTFLNRAFDQVLMDVALHQAPVTFVLDRAGITGDDGPSHHGMWDLALFAKVPGLRIAAPRDARRLREQLAEAITFNGPTLIRFPKGTIPDELPNLRYLPGVSILHGDVTGDVLIVAVGGMAAACVEAQRHLDRLQVTVVDPEWVVPVAPALLSLARKHRAVVVVEDGIRDGGVGDAITRTMHDNGLHMPMRTLGLPRRFISHGSRSDLLAEYGLTAAGIAESVMDLCHRSLK